VNPNDASGVYDAMYATLAVHDPPVESLESSDSTPTRDAGANTLELHLADVTTEPTIPLDFERFYRDSYAAIARALAVTLGDADLAREATDEGMIRAYVRWAKISGYDNPGGWVYRVGLNWARSLRRRLRRSLPFHDINVIDAPSVDPEIHRALLDLDVRLRAVVVCRLLLDWSVDETAVALDLAPGTVKSRLHRALAQLELTLGDHS
jgi:DNA-directed RNA polymerase specialized sigma24 family protein